MSAFTIVAGQRAYQAEQDSKSANVKPSSYMPGCWETESLVRWQAGAGREWRSAQLVKSVYGWSVRATSGLDGFAILAGCRRGELDGTFADALRWVESWVAQDPTSRYAYLGGLDSKAALEEVGILV
jgi:hypothetical protein